MKIYTNINENIDFAESINNICPNCYATIGFFDGVHLGHKYIISKLQEVAAENNSEELVITLWPHPFYYFNRSIKLLNTLQEKIKIFKNIGIKNLLILNFDSQIANLSTNDFIDKILVEKFNIQAIVMGYNNSFGKDANKSKECDDTIKTIRLQEFKLNGTTGISSSVIRNYLEQGLIEDATKLLGYNYILSGNIQHGYKIGRKLGFPTANLSVPETDKLIPADGAYIIEVNIGEKWLPAMLSIGNRPSFNGTEKSIEFHILDFEEDLYAQEVTIRLIKKIRPEYKFESVDNLIEQLNKDKETTKRFFE